jgi:uncharacterized protein (DUF3820 family)
MNTDSESDIEDTGDYMNEKMPFGKYKGQKISEVIEYNKVEGQKYMKWLLKNSLFFGTTLILNEM